MNGQIKKSHGSKFKLKVALAAIKTDKTMSELCQEFDVAISQIYAWKKQLNAPSLILLYKVFISFELPICYNFVY